MTRPRIDSRRRSSPLVAVFIVLAMNTSVQATTADLTEARRLIENGDDASALRLTEQVIASAPQDVDAQLLKGVLLTRLGRSDEGIEVFRALARARPELPEPHNNLAVLFAAQGRYEEAREALIAALELQPDYDVAHENLGDVYAKLATLSYRRAQRTNPSNVRAQRKAQAAEELLATMRPRHPSGKRGGSESRDSPVSAAERCIVVDGVDRADSSAISAWLERHGATAAVLDQGTGEPLRWRVFLPPLATPAQARARAASLEAQGVTDMLVITGGPMRNAISLGVYARQDRAQRRARALAELGVKATVEPYRRGGSSGYQVLARSTRASELLRELGAEFTNVRSGLRPCPN